MMVIKQLVLLVILPSAVVAVVESPLTRAYEGSSAQLRCNAINDSPVDWIYQRHPEEVDLHIVVGGHLLDECRQKFALNPIDNTLTINSPSLNDSGIYRCVENSGTGEVHSVQLVVLQRKLPESTSPSKHQEINTNRHNVAAIAIPVVIVPVALLVVVSCVIHSCRRRTKSSNLNVIEKIGISVFQLPQMRRFTKPSVDVVNELDTTVDPVFRHNLKSLVEDLKECIEADYGLVDQMFSRGLLTRSECSAIPAEQTVEARLDRLLSVMLTKNDKECREFAMTLAKTDQQHVVNYIRYPTDTAERCGDVRPLDKALRLCIDVNTPRLVELVSPTDCFLSNLVATGCTTGQQRYSLIETQDAIQKNRKLLQILRRRSVGHVKKFADCLRLYNQSHLAPLVLGTGVIVKVDATLDETSVDDVMLAENQIVAHFRVLMTQLKSNLTQCDLETRCRMMSMLDRELGMGVDLVEMRRQHGVGCYFHCRTFSSFRWLLELHDSKRLTGLMESLFQELVNKSEQVRIRVLTLTKEDCESCTHYFKSLSVAMQQEGQHMAKLSSELMERVLMRAFIAVFGHHMSTHRHVSVAERRTHSTMAAVCYSWWQTFHGWPRSDANKRCFRHRLQRLLGHVCRPYLRRPQLVTTLAQGHLVQCVTQLDDKIFVVCSRSETIKVFGPHHEALRDIDAIFLKAPRDIVASSETGSLYIADYKSIDPSGTVWQVTPEGHVEAFLPTETTSATFRPISLSMTSRRLLVTSRFKLSQYEVGSADELASLSLPGMWAKHAVETSRGTFVVCHKKPLPQVIEADVEGHVIRVYNDRQHLARPWHLATDDVGNIFLSDRYKHHVLLLTSELQLDRVLLDTKHNRLGFEPFRLCYVRDMGRLIIGSDYSGIQVFNVRLA